MSDKIIDIDTSASAGPLDRSDGHSLASVTGSHVTAATRDLDDDQANAIRWLYNWARDRKMTAKQLAEDVGLSWTVLYRVFTGKYPAALENVVQRINSYRKLAEDRATLGEAAFVETSVARKIFRACEYALVSQSMVFIYGEPQIGKTYALEEYQRRNNHGQTKLVRMPASAGVQLMMKEFARACYLSPKSSFENLREHVLNAIDHRHVLIVDELHQVFLSYQRGSAIKALEVIREIHDRTKCGMVLCGTLQLRKEIMLGQHADLLEQFRRRGVLEIVLPKSLPRQDLDKIVAGHGLEPAAGEALELQTDILRAHGLGKFVKFLQTGSRLAAKQKERLSWGHVIKAHDILAKLSSE